MKIIGYYCNNSGLIVNSEGRNRAEPPYLDFLLQDKFEDFDNSSKIIQVFYNINYNVANLLRDIHITKEQGKLLNDNEELFIPPYKIKYVQGKFLSIKKGSYFTNISDISQYCNVKMEGDESLHVCIAKAKEAAQVGMQVLEGMYSIGLHPVTITSPIRAFEKEKLEKLSLPTLEDIPDDVAEFADECCDASWLEGYRIGHWDKVYDYDLVSAYPHQTSQLLDIRYGDWIDTDVFVPKGYYGYYLCQTEIFPSSRLSPIMYIIKNGNNDYNRNFTPTGIWYRVLTKKQIEFMYHWNIGTVKVIKGRVWIPKCEIAKIPRPFKETMEWLFSEKENNIKAGNGQRKENIKRTANGIYGKLREVRRNKNPDTGKYEKIYGQYANPVYAAEIEVNTKLEDADFILRNNLRPVHIAVDGIVSLDKAKEEMHEHELGGWRLNNENKCLSISTGVIAIKGKFDEHPDEKKDFSLDYDWLVEAIRENPDSQVYTMRKKSPISLAIAVKDGGKRWEELGQLQNISRNINVGYEEKRMYKVKPKSGKENMECDLESYPLDVSILKGMENK